MKELVVTSPAFKEGGWIPERHSAYGEDVSPELYVSGISERARSVIITLDDLGHPIYPGYNHWVAWNIPPVSVIPENIPKGAVCEKPFHAEQGIAYGKHCYKGPKPPFNWNHDYKFTAYTLDCTISVGADSGKKEVLKAAEGHILQSGTLTGKYQRHHK